MKVRELIAKLSEFDPDLEVVHTSDVVPEWVTFLDGYTVEHKHGYLVLTQPAGAEGEEVDCSDLMGIHHGRNK